MAVGDDAGHDAPVRDAYGLVYHPHVPLDRRWTVVGEDHCADHISRSAVGQVVWKGIRVLLEADGIRERPLEGGFFWRRRSRAEVHDAPEYDGEKSEGEEDIRGRGCLFPSGRLDFPGRSLMGHLQVRSNTGRMVSLDLRARIFSYSSRG